LSSRGQLSWEIGSAIEADDAGVVELARRAGLSVDSKAERGRNQARLLVAKGEGPAVLGLALAWLVADEMEVVDIAVDESVRGRGLGRALLRELLEMGKRAGCVSAHLEVRENNPAAQALYRRLAFVEVGRRERYYKDGENALLFRCCLEVAQ